MNETIFIAIAIVAVIVFACALILINSKKKAKGKAEEMLQLFYQISTQQELVFNKKDTYPNKLIAIDYLKMKVVFLLYNKELKFNIIDLTCITNCHIKKSKIKLFEKGKNSHVIYEEHTSKIYLSFRTVEEIVIDVPIYDEIEDGNLEQNNCQEIAEKWQRIINDALIGSTIKNN